MGFRRMVPALLLSVTASLGLSVVHAAENGKQGKVKNSATQTTAEAAKVAKVTNSAKQGKVKAAHAAKAASAVKAVGKAGAGPIKRPAAVGKAKAAYSRRVTTKADFAAKKAKAIALTKMDTDRASGHAAKLAQTVGEYGVAGASASASPIVYDAEKDPVSGLSFASSIVLVQDAITGIDVLAKNPNLQAPIASIAKLMTAYVILEEGLNLDEVITVTSDDVDHIKNTRSRLDVGKQLTRRDLLHLALMSSENRAAAALGRTHPQGFGAFVSKMNETARKLGMTHTRYMDTTGLSTGNVSTASDLSKLVKAAVEHELIREFSTDVSGHFDVNRRAADEVYRNSNPLVRQGDWQIALQKTGYTVQAGRCVVMYAFVDERPYIMVLLDAPASSQRVADANRIRRVLSSPTSGHGAEIMRAKAAAEEQVGMATDVSPRRR